MWLFSVAETVDEDEMIKEWSVTVERTAFCGVEGETESWAPLQESRRAGDEARS